jgi:parallel beta-helix repeat protein
MNIPQRERRRLSKRKIIIGILLSVLLTNVLMACGLRWPFSAVSVVVPYLPVHNIDTGLDYPTIQEAIDAPETLDGHTIYCEAWNYTGFVVYKSLNIIGAPESWADGKVDIRDIAYVNITGFTVVAPSGYAAFSLNGANKCNIWGNRIIGDGAGIDIRGSSHNRISNNTIEARGVGIYIRHSSSYNTVADNRLLHNHYGILILNASNHNLVVRNWAIDITDWPIRLNWLESYYLPVGHNNITGNVFANSYGGIMLDYPSSNNLVSNNFVSNNSMGIWLRRSNKNAIFGNCIISNNYGAYLESSFENVISNNYFRNTNNAWDNGVNYWNITKQPGPNIVGGPSLGGNVWFGMKLPPEYDPWMDINRDGYVDISYNVPGNTNKDYLPLVPPTLMHQFDFELWPRQVENLGIQIDVELYPRRVENLGLDPPAIGTAWHELHPVKCRMYKLTSWEPGRVLSPGDQIDMWAKDERIAWFEVDEVTVDMTVVELVDDVPSMTYYLDYKCGYWVFKKDVWRNPISSKWNEIKRVDITGVVIPGEGRSWHLTSWIDSGDGKLGPCDWVDMTLMHPSTGAGRIVTAHVKQVTVSLKLTKKPFPPFEQYYMEFMGTLEGFQASDRIRNPMGTAWHEIWPAQSRQWVLTSWEDVPILSPSDQVDLTDEEGKTRWYHVDKLTVAMNITTADLALPWEWRIVKFEGSLEQFKKYHRTNMTLGPVSTQWHEVNPNYSRQWHLSVWDDNGDGVLGPSDYIWMVDKETGDRYYFHVETISTDMWLSLKIISTDWHQIHPRKSLTWHLKSWQPGVVLSPGDQIKMKGVDPKGREVQEWFEVDEVTVDLTVLDIETEVIRHLDYKCGYWKFKQHVWRRPISSKWNEIKPNHGYSWHLTSWIDNGDGRLGPSDRVDMTLMYPSPGAGSVSWFHVMNLTVTLKLTKKPVEPPLEQYYLEFIGELIGFQALNCIKNPISTWWREIWPLQDRIWRLERWDDVLLLSPSDQIDMSWDMEIAPPHWELLAIPYLAWFHVDKVTVAMWVTPEIMPGPEVVKFEGSLEQFKKYHWTDPVSTEWREANPEYGRQWHLAKWRDNGDGKLGPSDFIDLINKHTGETSWVRVDAISTDIIVHRKLPHILCIIPPPIPRDIAIIKVAPSENVVAQGFPVKVNVTIQNEGEFNETVGICVIFWRDVKFDDPSDFLPLDWLSYDLKVDIYDIAWAVLAWDTSDIATGNYTIVGYSLPYEDDDVEDNVYIDGWVEVRLLGDVTGDGYVTLADIGKLDLIYSGWIPGPPYIDPTTGKYLMPDMTGDGYVTLADIGKLDLIYSGVL